MGKRILVVDDESGVREVLSVLLDEEGYSVATARDGQEALRQVQAFAPDLMLLDLMMPVLDGYGVLEALRASPAEHLPRVLVMSASQIAHDEVRQWLGPDGCLAKPFETEELLQRVQRLIGAP